MSDYRDLWYQSGDGLTLYARDYQPTQSRFDYYNGDLPTLICIPGLTRNSADFEELCLHFKKDYRVIAVDLRGRGLSAYDPNPNNYLPTTYVEDVQLLIGRLGLSSVVFIGTSLGGFVSLLIAAQQPSYLHGLIINDFGPQLEPTGLERIKSYVGKLPPVSTWEAAIDQAKRINGKELPDLSEAEWLAFARKLYRDNGAGLPELNYDPNIAIPFESTAGEDVSLDLWPVFDATANIPLLFIRGELSDLISPQAVRSMRQRRPDMQYAEIPRCGHAPLLNEKQSLTAIEGFLQTVYAAEPAQED